MIWILLTSHFIDMNTEAQRAWGLAQGHTAPTIWSSEPINWTSWTSPWEPGLKLGKTAVRWVGGGLGGGQAGEASARSRPREEQTGFSLSMGKGKRGISGPGKPPWSLNSHPSCRRRRGQETNGWGGRGSEDSRDGQAGSWGKLPAGGHHWGVIWF